MSDNRDGSEADPPKGGRAAKSLETFRNRQRTREPEAFALAIEWANALPIRWGGRVCVGDEILRERGEPTLAEAWDDQNSSDPRYRFRLGAMPPKPDYYSPGKVGRLLGLRPAELAQRAGVPVQLFMTQPEAPQVQAYLGHVVDVLIVAFEYADDEKRAAQWFLTQELRDFGGHTPDQLVTQGNARVVIAYLESIMGGATG
ncbi:MbcA/ParS/Xre antitoxin family protein [Luteimonas pelagia]